MNNSVDIKNLKVAKRYALAFAESSISDIDKAVSDMKLIKELIFENEELKTFFLHPVVSLKDKKDTIEEAFKSKLSGTSFNFIETLLDESRFGIFNTIYEVFLKESERLRNIERVEVTSAVEIEEKEKTKLVDKLKEKLSKNIFINYNLDEEILGGLVVKVEDKVIDLSLKTKFENLKKL